MRFFFGLFLLLSQLSWSQDSESFYANASSLEVVEGTNFQVDFIMVNFKGNLNPPSFEDFIVVSGPSQTSSYSNVNGKVTQQYSYGYTLAPKSPGKFTIGSATCTANGRSLTTQPITITVIKRDSKSLQALGLPSDEDIFVRLELSKDTAYMGEKVELVYKLYTRKEVRSYDIKNESDYAGFYVRPRRVNNKRSAQEEIDGQLYNTQILEKRLLFPQQTGEFTFEAANVTLGLPDPSRRSSGFFFNSSTKPFPVRTNEEKLVVENLPRNAPASFSGAIGRFRMVANVDKRELTTDDAITLKMTVSGNGDAKYILPASQEHLKDFEVYDPNIIERGEREMFGEIHTIKEFEYLIVPQKAGRQSLQAEYTYFDTDSNAYVTLKSQIFPLMVEQGSSKRRVELSDNDRSDRSFSGLKENGRLRKKSRGLFAGPLHLSFVGLTLLGIGLVFWKKRQLDIEAGIDPSLKKKKKAKSIAEQRLSKAKTLLDSGDTRAFYDEISHALIGFIADKLNVPNSEISKSNVKTRLLEADVTEEKVNAVSEILSECEMAIFAGKKGGNLDNFYSKTKALIDGLAKKI